MLMLGIHNKADAVSFECLDGIVLALTGNRSEQAQSSPVRPLGRCIRNLIQLGSSTHGMGHFARGDAEGRSDCGEFRGRFR